MRSTTRADGADVYALVAACPPLDLNSCYAYVLWCEHFGATCVVAEGGQGLDGFISAYRRPDAPDVLFVWQVAVHPRARGSGLAGRMLSHLLNRESCQGVLWLETTVSPGNLASRALFQGFARQKGVALTEEPLFVAAHFGGQAHDDEPLLRIGPLAPP